MLLIMSSSPQKKISGQQFKRTSLTPHGIGECLRSFPQFVMPLTLTFASPIGIFPASPSGCSGTHWARTPLTSTFARRACRSADSSAPAAPRRRSARQPVCPGTVFVACASSGNENDDDAIDGDSLFLRGPVPGDRIVRTMSANGEVSVRVMACTGLVSGATRLHRTSPVATAAFGRTLACSLLLAAGKKDGETLQIEFRGDGPIRGITAIANGEGCVRGYLGDPRIALPPNAAGKLDVAKAVGKGILAVVRNSKYAQQPYTGLVPITTGEIAEDVAVYLADSEQTPSALGVGVYVSETGSVTGAGGFLVQLLPGASEETISTVEKNVAALAPVCIDRHEAPYSLIGISVRETPQHCPPLT